MFPVLGWQNITLVSGTSYRTFVLGDVIQTAKIHETEEYKYVWVPHRYVHIYGWTDT